MSENLTPFKITLKDVKTANDYLTYKNEVMKIINDNDEYICYKIDKLIRLSDNNFSSIGRKLRKDKSSIRLWTVPNKGTKPTLEDLCYLAEAMEYDNEMTYKLISLYYPQIINVLEMIKQNGVKTYKKS